MRFDKTEYGKSVIGRISRLRNDHGYDFQEIAYWLNDGGHFTSRGNLWTATNVQTTYSRFGDKREKFSASEYGKLVISQILWMRNRNWTLQDIADTLNKRGYTTPTGKPWSTSTVNFICHKNEQPMENKRVVVGDCFGIPVGTVSSDVLEDKTNDLPDAVVRAFAQDVEDDVDVFDIPIGVTLKDFNEINEDQNMNKLVEPLNIPAAGMTIFENKAFGSVRTIMEGNDPWFVGKDVCGCLGISSHRDSLRHLDDDEKRECLIDTPSGKQTMTVISESGLYSLILRSRKKEAKEFKRWVTHEILPTIRKTGGVYMTDEAMEAVVTDPDFMIGILQNLKKIKQERDEANQKCAEATRTKSWIGDKRQATAMATASREKRRADKEEKKRIALEKSIAAPTHVPAKAIMDLGKYFRTGDKGFWNVLGTALKKMSVERGYKVKDIPHEKYCDASIESRNIVGFFDFSGEGI